MPVNTEDEPPDVEALVDALVDGKLAEYLLNTDTANELIREIAAETGLPRAAVRIVFKLLAPPLVRKIQTGTGLFGQRLIKRSADLVSRVPGYGVVARKLLLLRQKLDDDIKRRERLESILAGEHPAADLEHAEGLSNELRVALRQLSDLEQMRTHFDARLGGMLERLNPQPPLIPKLLESNDVNRLKFGARRVPFLGRREEQGRLREFLGSPARFSWWLVTGSGGQGKSRLALELCLTAGTAWRAGFLPETAAYDQWDRWQPEAATHRGRLRHQQDRYPPANHHQPHESSAFRSA